MSEEGTTLTRCDRYARRRVVYLVVGALSLLFSGLIYAWSIFSSSFETLYGYDRIALSTTFSISMIANCVGGLLSAWVSARFSLRASMVIAAVLMGVGFLSTSLCAGLGIGALYLFYGVLCGLGCGFALNATLSSVNLWFPDRIGFSSGVLLLSVGFGALVLGTPTNLLIEQVGTGNAFLLLALASSATMGLAAWVLRTPAESVVIVDKQEETPAAGTAANPSRAFAGSFHVLKTPTFVLFMVWAVVVAAAALALIGSAKQGAVAVGMDTVSATLLVGVVSIANGAGRIIHGIVQDRIGLIHAMSVITICVASALLFLLASFLLANRALFVTGAVVMGVSYGGIPVCSAFFSMERFGPKQFARNYALINLGVIPSSIISSVVNGNSRSILDDVGVLIVFICLTVLGMVDLFILSRRYDREVLGRDQRL
jgi:MFS transporter, OFA family, oxalate/formate antiporter